MENIEVMLMQRSIRFKAYRISISSPPRLSTLSRKRPYALQLRRKTTGGYCNRFHQSYTMLYGILRSSQTLTVKVHRLTHVKKIRAIIR
jgi:hypothetical protein